MIILFIFSSFNDSITPSLAKIKFILYELFSYIISIINKDWRTTIISEGFVINFAMNVHTFIF